MSGRIGAGNHANGKFFNPGPKRAPKVDADNPGLISRLLTKRPNSVRPKDPIPVHPLTRPDLDNRRAEAETHLYRLGHSTILMKFGHDYWITDPVFCERTSPSQKIGPKRFHAPPLKLSDLPKIAVVVISHNHYDHLDRATIRALAPSVEQFIVPLGVARYLQKWGVEPDKIVELDWWQSHARGDVEVTATPSQHFSGRGLHDRNKSLWASFVFRHAGEQVFFSSDSGYFHGFRQIAERFGRFAVSMLECGAWDVA